MAVWAAGLAVARSFSMDSVPGWYVNGNLLEFLDQLAAGLLLPLVSLLTVIYVGWRLRPDLLRSQLDREADFSFSLWRLLLRYVTPVIILGAMATEFIQV